MNGTDAIRIAMNSATYVLNLSLSDLSDADLLLRPVANANHIAWQLGHLISGERYLVTQQLPEARYPELTADFLKNHSKEAAQADGPAGFLTKSEYQSLFEQVRSATLAVLDSLSDADLDRPTLGQIAGFAPKLGGVLMLVANHPHMHIGQITVVRRLLGKPVLF